MDFRRYVWGWETLISRYRVCSELAGSQSERVLTLAAHSVLPRRPLSRGPFRSLCLLPFRPCSLARSFHRQATLSPYATSAGGANYSPCRPSFAFSLSFAAANHIRPWRKLRRSFPSPELASESTFRSFSPFLSLFFGFLYLSPFLGGYATGRSSCRQYRPGLITFMSYSFRFLSLLEGRGGERAL